MTQDQSKPKGPRVWIYDTNIDEMIDENDKLEGAEIFFVEQKHFAEAMDVIREMQDELSRYKLAIDKIYNHNEASRNAVVEYFGLHHNIALLDSVAERIKRLEGENT